MMPPSGVMKSRYWGSKSAISEYEGTKAESAVFSGEE